MKRIILFLAALLCCVALNASTRITATVTLTNNPADGETFVVNTSSRTFKTSVATPTTQVLIGADIGASTTNLWQHIALNGIGYGMTQLWGTSTNIIKIIAPLDTSLAVSSSGTYFSVSYSTQTVTSATAIRVPLASVSNYERTNHATLLVDGIGDYSQSALDQTSTAASELVGLSNTQTISGQKTFSGSTYFSAPTLTNGVNYGNAFKSPGSGTRSEQFGTSASATGTDSVAVGYLAEASDTGASAFGRSAVASGDSSTAIGNAAEASGQSSTAVGQGTIASGYNSSAFGQEANTSYDYSLALMSQCTKTNQISIGWTGYETRIPGWLTVGQGITNSTYYGTVGSLTSGLWSNGGLTNTTSTNMTSYGTNTLAGIYKLPKTVNTSLANGNNANIDFGTCTLVKINAGPTSAFAICGIQGGSDGRLLILDNRTGQNMTIANDSGVDGTAANRIYTATGSDHATTGNGVAMLFYDSTDSRWHLINLEQ